MPQSQLAQLCAEENKVRENYYSDTYRSSFSLNGMMREWDVTHVSIPFAPEKEARFMARFGIGSRGMTSYYEHLAERLPYEAKLLDTIHQNGGAFEALAGNLVRYLYIESVPKEGRGSDIYYVTEPMDPLLGSDFIHHDVVSLLNLLQLGARFSQMLKLMLGTGLHVGAFDLDMVYLTRPDSGRPMIKLGSLLYASLDGEAQLPLLESTPPSAPEDVSRGEPLTVSSDTDALCGLLWTLASGRHYTMPPDYESAPQYAPDELVDALVRTLEAETADGDEALKELHNALFRMIRQIRKGEMDDLVIPIAPPVYPGAPPEESQREAAEKGTDVRVEQEPEAGEREEKREEAPSPDSIESSAERQESLLEEQAAADESPGATLMPTAVSDKSESIPEVKEPVVGIHAAEEGTIYCPLIDIADMEIVDLPAEDFCEQRQVRASEAGGPNIAAVLFYIMLMLCVLMFALEYFRLLEPFQIPVVHEFADTVRRWIAG